MTASESRRNGDRIVAGLSPAPHLFPARLPEEFGGDDRPTIGLVSAIPEEFVAMRALIDGGAERNIPGDPAFYVSGSVPSRDVGRSHRVALTLLGATATNGAANGCANMIRSFPSIRVVVMVGIAAGVPNPYRRKRHVRLGDIVVATEGVVDYDHVRAGTDGVEPRRSFPLPSPRLVRCADLLKADELRGVRPWEQWLDRDGSLELAGYGRPPDHTDILHDSAGFRLEHPRRNVSGHRRGFPKVHYGTIGSADRSLRDAAMRDELAARYGFLAIEMEGAGIGSSSFLNGPEWFVVRGISDYGDSDRDETWCRHASLVAAAYVRSLLAKCMPIEIQYDHGQLAVDSLQ